MEQPSTQISYYYTRGLFLRALAIVYFFAFASLAMQIIGLVGKQGILPAANFLSRIGEHIQTQAFWTLPTIFWFNSSDFFLSAVCIAGIILSALAFFGVASVFSFAMLWFLYLSLINIGQDFLSFQWDILLLETGFLGIFLAPWQWWEESGWKRAGRRRARPVGADLSRPYLPLRAPPEIQTPLVIIWLLRLLLFRLMFESGFVKLASGDLTWRNLTALNYHYFTQPLPTPVAWYAAQLPGWFNQLSVVMVFAVELLTPFLIFAGRKARFIAAITLVSFQILIAFTGNYAFFNLLTIALCICLLDDQHINSIIDWIRKIQLPTIFGTPEPRGRLHRPLRFQRSNIGSNEQNAAIQEQPAIVVSNEKTSAESLPLPKAQQIISILVAILVGVLSIVTTLRGTFGVAVPAFMEELSDISGRYFICNTYGLFAVMTTKRMEIQIEGSNDGIFWDEYEFKYKPGNLDIAPPIVAPQQPRLDWQMWFAALSDFRNNPWFLNLAFRLLQGEPTVLKLLANNPFPKGPPQYIRARLYDYSFTNESERHKSGHWWKRELVGDYLPSISLQNNK